MIAEHPRRFRSEHPSPLQMAFRAGEILRIPAGTELYRMGEPATHIYWIRRGAVKLLKADRHLHPRILHVIGPDHPLGLPDVFVGTYLHTAVTLEYSLICRTTRERILKLCEMHPDFMAHVIRRLDEKLRHSEKRIALAATQPAEERLRHMLNVLYHEFGTDNRGYLNLHLPLHELAEMLGMSMKTLRRVLQRWTSRGWVRVEDDRLQLLRPETLFAHDTQ